MQYYSYVSLFLETYLRFPGLILIGELLQVTNEHDSRKGKLDFRRGTELSCPNEAY
jgi:hypothetical protein